MEGYSTGYTAPKDLVWTLTILMTWTLHVYVTSMFNMYCQSPIRSSYQRQTDTQRAIHLSRFMMLRFTIKHLRFTTCIILKPTSKSENIHTVSINVKNKKKTISQSHLLTLKKSQQINTKCRLVSTLRNIPACSTNDHSSDKPTTTWLQCLNPHHI